MRVLTIYLVNYLTSKVITFNRISKISRSVEALKGGVSYFIEY